MIAPGEVAASTSRRHTLGYWCANFCAMPPPHETPATSISLWQSSPTSSAASRARFEGRYGMEGIGEPPMPGTSKMIAVVSVSASRKGLANSQFAPMPLNSNNGGLLATPCLSATRNNWPRIEICRTSISPGLDAKIASCWSVDPPLVRRLLVVSSVKDVGPRRLGYHRIPRATQRNGRVDLLTRARMQPVPPIEPPASFPFLGGSEERIGPCGIDSPDYKGRLRVCRWIEQALQVAAVRQHESRALAHDLSRLVNALPWRNVVGDAGDDIAVRLHFAHVDGFTVQRELARIDERVGEVEIQIVAVQTRREARRIGGPIEGVEGRAV